VLTDVKTLNDSIAQPLTRCDENLTVARDSLASVLQCHSSTVLSGKRFSLLDKCDRCGAIVPH
jgi:hypothetical protein